MRRLRSISIMGLGPVLHFGGYSYPSRYSEGYPLILAAAYPILGGHLERLCLVTMAMGLIAIVALYIVSLQNVRSSKRCFPCAILAALPGLHHLLDIGVERRSDSRRSRFWWRWLFTMRATRKIRHHQCDGFCSRRYAVCSADSQ